MLLAGEVDRQGIRDFVAAEIALGRGTTIWSDLLSGNDVIFGNGSVYDLSGLDGDDIVLNADNVTGGAAISGGKGNDILFTSNTANLSGGEGKDSYVADSRYWNVRDFVPGKDRLLFDAAMYPELGDRVTDRNFRIGPTAIDADDRLIINRVNNHYLEVFIDPDGSGPQCQIAVGTMDSRKDLTAHDFRIVDANTLIPDIFMGASAKVAAISGSAFATDRPELHNGFAHPDAIPTLPHGLIQLV